MSYSFTVGDYVMIHRTTDPQLDGKIVRILNNINLNSTGVYLVSLNPPVHGQEALQLVRGCLKEIE